MYKRQVYKQQLGKDCEDLQKAYADVLQESPRSTEKGYVKVSFLEPDEEHGYTEQTLISLEMCIRDRFNIIRFGYLLTNLF